MKALSLWQPWASAIAEEVVMAGFVNRITIDIDAGLPAGEIDGVIAAVVRKIGTCWADTTSGPIHDDGGRHVANARVEKLPVGLQLALERLA